MKPGDGFVKTDIRYGKDGKMPLVIPGGIRCEIVYPNAVKCGDERETVMNALAKPLGGRTLDEFLSGAKSVLVVVNDATRPTPTAKMLDCFFDRLNGKNTHFISAVGSHRPPTEAEHRDMFGSHYDELKERILVHDCRKDSDMVSFGKTRLGTDIKLNRAVAEHDRIIITTSVEPHYFAGYTGGRKSLFPGLAAYSSIAQNHKWALDERASTFALRGNPVHDDMEEIVGRLGKELFAVQAVLDAHHEIYAAFAGDIVLTLGAAVEKANEVFAVKIRGKADIVVTVAPYPTDIDLYQAQKSLDNGKNAVEKDGIIILVAECRDAIGNETFYKLLSSADVPRDVFTEIEKGYKLGYHKAAKMAEIMLNCRIWAVTGLKREILEKIFICPFPDIQTAVDDAIKVKGKDAKVLILMDGNLTVPMLA